jgi:hypothetical protein
MDLWGQLTEEIQLVRYPVDGCVMDGDAKSQLLCKADDSELNTFY